MKAADPSDTARVELLLAALRLPAINRSGPRWLPRPTRRAGRRPASWLRSPSIAGRRHWSERPGDTASMSLDLTATDAYRQGDPVRRAMADGGRIYGQA